MPYSYGFLPELLRPLSWFSLSLTLLVDWPGGVSLFVLIKESKRQNVDPLPYLAPSPEIFIKIDFFV